MNTGAELTLQIVRVVQAHAGGDVSRVPQRWVFWPRGERLVWEDARALLTQLAKPVLIAPLLEFGMLGIWDVEAFEVAHRQTVEQQLTSQVQYYADKFAALSPESGLVRFGSGASAGQMTRDELLRWATEYALNVGISIGPAADTGEARILVRPSGGGAPLMV